MADTKKIITLAELKEHTTRENLYVLIHGKVYAAAKFLDEHPGGDEVILAEAGKDATEAFEDVGHSDEAREILAGLLVGEVEGGSAAPPKPTNTSPSSNSSDSSGSSVTYLIPVALIGAFLAWRFVFAP